MDCFQVEQSRCYLITSVSELKSAIASLSDASVLAVDTEFLRVNTFYPIAGLIQLATADSCYLIDPILLKQEDAASLSLLKPLLVAPERTLVMHACSEDLEVFQQLLGALPAKIFDTQIAAGFLGQDAQPGLQKLLLSYCDLDIPKDETRSDWTQRPLTANQLHYAVLDVVALLQLYGKFKQRLEASGRLHWCLEDCARLLAQYQQPLPLEDYYLGIANAWKLSATKLRVLQALAIWREQLARHQDRPRNFIFSDRELLMMADKLPRSLQALAQLGKIKPVQIRRYGELALTSLTAALSAVESNPGKSAPALPKPPKPASSALRKIVKTIKPALEAEAQALQMATEKFGNRRQLETLVEALRQQQPVTAFYQGWRQTELLPLIEAKLKDNQGFLALSEKSVIMPSDPNLSAATSTSAEGLFCSVYRSAKKSGLYVFIDKSMAVSELPKALLQQLGTPGHVMDLLISPATSLAQVEATDVLDGIAKQGYFLQLPPTKAEPW